MFSAEIFVVYLLNTLTLSYPVTPFGINQSFANYFSFFVMAIPVCCRFSHIYRYVHTLCGGDNLWITWCWRNCCVNILNLLKFRICPKMSLYHSTTGLWRLVKLFTHVNMSLSNKFQCDVIRLINHLMKYVFLSMTPFGVYGVEQSWVSNINPEWYNAVILWTMRAWLKIVGHSYQKHS